MKYLYSYYFISVCCISWVGASSVSLDRRMHVEQAASLWLAVGLDVQVIGRKQLINP